MNRGHDLQYNNINCNEAISRVRSGLISQKNTRKMVLSWEILFIYVSVILTKEIFVNGRPEGFHFTRFSGPVSGPVSQVEIAQLPHLRGHSGALRGQKALYDYVAKPDYTFAYGVEDPESGNYQNQKETRDGDVVKGEYTVIEADGSTRRVVYTADPKNGFQATVHLSEPNKERAARQENFVKTLNESLEKENKSFKTDS